MAVILLIYERSGFFYSNTPFSLRGSGCFDASEAGDDLGNGSGRRGLMARSSRGMCVSQTVSLLFSAPAH